MSRGSLLSDLDQLCDRIGLTMYSHYQYLRSGFVKIESLEQRRISRRGCMGHAEQQRDSNVHYSYGLVPTLTNSSNPSLRLPEEIFSQIIHRSGTKGR